MKSFKHTIIEPGTHTLKMWMADTVIVFQKFVIDAEGLKPSYAGPPGKHLRDGRITLLMSLQPKGVRASRSKRPPWPF
ncbi:MAG: hypothetical protein JXD23_03355 [Spirochaetales bacterium]|nr:hypothetical protein [Spirochaetales bacterium]